jgi:hypothetical protein
MNNCNLCGRTSITKSLGMLLIAFVSGSSVAAGLGNTEQFAVEMAFASNEAEFSGKSITMKYYVGKDRMRMEVSMGGTDSSGTITVFDGDQITMYRLIPQTKQYIKTTGTADDLGDENPGWMIGSPEDADHPCQTDSALTCEKIGSDTLLNRSVDKYLVKDVEDGVPTENLIWFDRELLFPIKTDGDDGILEATSVKIGTQPDELFEIPAGYTELKTTY